MFVLTGSFRRVEGAADPDPLDDDDGGRIFVPFLRSITGQVLNGGL